jgi:hypothetical protein
MIKVTQYTPLLLLSLLACVAWKDDTPKIAQTDPPIRTDKQAYSVTYTPPPYSAIKVTIKITYTNRTGGAVYLSGCPVPNLPTVEKKIEDKWITVLKHPRFMCYMDPIPIESGGTYEHMFHLRAYPPGGDNRWRGSPVLPREMEKIAGTYRLVMEEIERDDTSLLPLEERISNEFKLIE